MPSEAMPQTAKGVLAAVASNVLFAMLFLYSSWMKPMNGTDVFAWRMVGMLFALFALASLTHSWQGALNFAAGIGKDWKRWLLVILPTPILASQLWLFVWSPVNGEGINVAMGYFLFPLAMMLVGRIWFKERLGGPQRLAVTLACVGVACQLWRNGAFSWATVWVFGTYPLYYLLRRKLGVPSLIGLLVDLIIITPCMLVYIVFFFRQPGHDSRPTEFDCIHRSDRHQQRAGDVSEPSGQQHAADGRIRHAELSRTYFTVRHRGTLAGRTARKQRTRRLRPDLAGPERDDS